MLVAAYGSLKEGFYNHRVLGEDAKFLGKSTVRGVMYWNGSYPKLYHFDQHGEDDEKNACNFCYNLARDHELEVYDVREKPHAQYIQYMELGAGYIEEEIDTEWGPAKIYYMPHERFDERDKWIPAYTQDLFKQ